MSRRGFDNDMQNQKRIRSRFVGEFKRRHLSEMCLDGITKSGAWCLERNSPPTIIRLRKQTDELPRHHVRADLAIVSFLSMLMSTGNTVIDLGAGVGQYGRELVDMRSEYKSQYMAFDGATNVESFTNRFVKHANLALKEQLPVADWVLSLEVGEHIGNYMENLYIENLHNSNRKGIVLSWAILGQSGNHHVNNHSPEYIMHRFTSIGYSLDEALTWELRKNSTYPWFHKSIYVFRR